MSEQQQIAKAARGFRDHPFHPLNWTAAQWGNFGAFALASAATGAWWTEIFSTHVVNVIHSVLIYLVTLINFGLGKSDPSQPPSSN